MRQAARLTVLLSGLVSGLVQAAPVPALLIQFQASPGSGFNRQAASILTVTARGYHRRLVLAGVPDGADPTASTARLNNLTLTLPASVRGRVTLRARFYLCDRLRGVCTVEEQSRTVDLSPGLTPVLLRAGAPH